MAKINDFGEKIGGARKDVWRKEGLTEENLIELNEAERMKYVSRDYVWPLPNSKKLVEDGLDVFVAFLQREIRKEIRPYPCGSKFEDIDTIQRRYIRIVRKIKQATMNLKNRNEIVTLYKNIENYFGETYTDWNYCVRPSILYLQFNHKMYEEQIIRRNFPYGKKKETKKRKKKFIPAQLEHIEREGINYRKGCNINASIWQREFNFRGVEFGNWLSQKDRQFSMNYCYDALKDLATALNIDEKDIAFNGSLALAFGARGTSGASAHYENLREVINLTKMHGAGCTAHEWMHALDDYIAKFYHLECAGRALASMAVKEYSKLPKEFTDLVRALSKDACGNYTDYYRGSSRFDRQFAKDAFGFWSSPCEMLARAFGCYVKDCYGKKSDYLIAHADSYVFEYEDQCIAAIPQGEEREIFNEMFDCLFYRLKKDGLLHNPIPKKNTEVKSMIMKRSAKQITLHEDFTGQLSFVV